jgi:NADH dehydrogenase [ubiquinone] 1 alpha subcomplex assembly factor 6
LPQEGFDALLVGRERDLDDAPFATLAELEAYAASTSGALVALALSVLDATDYTSLAHGSRVGIGYALTGLLRALPFHARQGRCLIPDAVLAAHGTDRDAVLALKPSPAIAAAVADLAAAASQALAPVRTLPAAWPALAVAVLARRHLKTLRRAGHDVFRTNAPAEPGAGAVLALIGASIVRRA